MPVVDQSPASNVSSIVLVSNVEHDRLHILPRTLGCSHAFFGSPREACKSVVGGIPLPKARRHCQMDLCS